MTQIFISYARENEKFVDELRAQLERQGYETWIDRNDIRAGKEWLQEIFKGIDDADVLILVITPEAMRSENVTCELKYALDRNKRILPILLRPTDLPPLLKNLQYVDFCEVQCWDKVMQELPKKPSLRIVPSKGLWPDRGKKAKP